MLNDIMTSDAFEKVATDFDSEYRRYVCPYDGDIISVHKDVFYGYCPTCGLTFMDYVPKPHQEEFHKSSAKIRLNLGGYGSGKSCVNSSVITTPVGDRVFGDLQIGDFVFGSNGQPTEITGVFPQGVLDVYRVTFSDGAYLDVSEDHLWTVKYKNSHSKVFEQTLATKDIDLDFKYKYFINTVEPLNYGNKKGDIDMYVLGALIADGSIVDGKIQWTKGANSVVKGMETRCNLNIGKGIRHFLNKGNNPDVHEFLNKTNLMGKKSREKFIPQECFYLDISDRMDLLRGLMDGDGTPQHYDREVTKFKYGTTSEQLANDFVRLVTGLGGLAYKVFDKRDETFYITIHTDFNPFLYSEWKEKWETSESKRSRFRNERYIESIEYVYEEACTCIMVDAEDSLYVGDSQFHVLTHNTTMSCAEIAEHILTVDNGRTMLVANTLEQARRTIIAELKKFIDLERSGKFVESHTKTPLEWTMKNGHEIFVMASDSDEKLRSLNITAFYMEEASGIDVSIYNQLKARLRNNAAIVRDKEGNIIDNRLLGIVCSNPEDGWLVDDVLKYCSKIYVTPKVPKRPLLELTREPAEDHEAFLSSSRDNQDSLPPGFIQTLITGKSRFWIAKYIDCDITTKEGLIYPMWVDHVSDKAFPLSDHWKRIVGYDSGWRDPTAILFGAIDPKRGIIHLYEEYSETNKVLSHHAEYLNKSLKGKEMLMPMQASAELFSSNVRTGRATNADYFQTLLDVPIEAAKTPIIYGIQKVRDYLDNGKIIIYPHLTHLRSEFRTYVDKGRDSKEVPVDVNNHFMDALRYMIAPLPDNPHEFNETYISSYSVNVMNMERGYNTSSSYSMEGEVVFGHQFRQEDHNIKEKDGAFYYDEANFWDR